MEHLIRLVNSAPSPTGEGLVFLRFARFTHQMLFAVGDKGAAL